MGSNNKTKILTVVILWLITAGYMALIYFLSSRPLHLPSVLPAYFDKLLHVSAYMLLTVLLYTSLKKSGLTRYIFLVSCLAAGIYGITDELHQSFVPGRYASFADVAADFIGVALGSFGAGQLKL